MCKSFSITIICTLLFTLISGCSSGNKSLLTSPEIQPAPQNYQEAVAGKYLWGFYDVVVDQDNSSVDFIRNRSGNYAMNVVTFLNNDADLLSITFNGTSPGPGYIDVDMDLSITHPIDNEKFTAYDVMGVFMGRGSGLMNYVPDMKYPVNGVDPILLNADGYTRWYNASEFVGDGIFSYTPGLLSSPGYTPTSELNGYKYFAKSLGDTTDLMHYLKYNWPYNGYFKNGTSNTRNYQIRFPVPDPGIKYGYAIVANWSGGAPEFHPSHACEAVGCEIDDQSNLFFVDSGTWGGNIIADISIYDWYSEPDTGAMTDYQLVIESSVLDAPYTFSEAEMTPVFGSTHLYTYHVEIPADVIASATDNEMWVIVKYPDNDYTNPFGIENDAGGALSAYFRFDLDISGEVPDCADPPEITTVSVPYAFEETHYEFQFTATGGEGELFWTVLPELPSGLALSESGLLSGTPELGTAGQWDVIVSVVDSCWTGSQSDEKDFTLDVLSAGSPAITVLYPNGGEYWVVGTDEEITWDSENLIGTVFIDYSKDNFIADINSIATDIENTGAYVWEGIPDDLSDTVRIRISSTDDPLVFDTSDEDFSIGNESGWALTWGGESSDTARGVSIDIDGNVLVGGLFVDIMTTSRSYLRKYKPSGEMIFDIVFGKGEASDVVSDSSGNIYLTGHFSGTDIDFDPGPGEDLKTGEINGDVYLTKFDSDGTYLWTHVWGTEWHDTSSDACVDENDNIYINGFCQDGNMFLRKYDIFGNLLWDYIWDAYGSRPGELYMTGTGHFYLGGTFAGDDVDFDPGPGEDMHTSLDVFLTDAFIMKFDIDMNYQWGKIWGGDNGTDTVYGITEDSIGNLLFAGGYYGTDVDFDPGPGTDLRTADNFDIFISRFSPDGNYINALTWGGSGHDLIMGMTRSQDYGYYITGTFSSTDMDLDPGPGVDIHSSNGFDDVFTARFDPSFNYMWGRSFGESSFDYTRRIPVSDTGACYIAGYFYGSDDGVEFAPVGEPCYEDSDIHSTASEHPDVFFVKYLADGCWSQD